MSVRDVPPDEPSPQEGSLTAGEGTPFAVDVSRDRRARWALFMFVAGPVIWSTHFLLVYLVVEAGCSGDGPGLSAVRPARAQGRHPGRDRRGGLRRPRLRQLVVPALAGRASTSRPSTRPPTSPVASPDRDRGGTLAFAGFLLSLLSVVTILAVGLPALVLPSC